MKRFEYAKIQDYDLMGLITESYVIVADKKFDKKNIQILANTECCLQSIAFGIVFGMPDNFGEEFQPLVLEDSLPLQKLERACENHVLVEKRFGNTGETTEVTDSEIDPATVIFIITSILKLIELLKKKKKNG
jgi:hypothetical protein